jgi:hypothetical protein
LQFRQFIDWYCSEPRLAFNKPSSLDSSASSNPNDASPTINLPLATAGGLHLGLPIAGC